MKIRLKGVANTGVASWEITPETAAEKASLLLLAKKLNAAGITAIWPEPEYLVIVVSITKEDL